MRPARLRLTPELRRPLTLLLIGVVAAAGGVAVALAAGGATEGSTYTYGVGVTISRSCPCGILASFGDGSTTSVSDPGTSATYTFTAPHVYTNAGVYTYALTVTSCVAGIGCGSSQTGTTPVADAVLSGSGGSAVSVGVGAASTVALGHFTDADPTARPPSHYRATITWGDGAASLATITAAAGGGFDVTGTHTWTTAGTYSVRALAADNAGGVLSSTASLVTPVTVTAPTPPPATTTTAPPPQAVIAAFPHTVIGGAPVALSSAGTTGGTAPLTYRWTFCSSVTYPAGCAAGSPSATGAQVTYAFPYAPVHDLKRLGRGADPTRRRSSTLVVLTVTDALGRSSTATAPVSVVPNLAPASTFVIGSSQPYGQDDVTFEPQAFDPNAGDRVVEEDWDFTGDGQPELVCKITGCTAVDPELASAYTPGPGIFSLARRHSRATTGTSVNVKSDKAFQASQVKFSLASFPAFRWNFARASLDASGLAPLFTVDLSTLADPSDTGRSKFLRDLAYLEYWETPLAGEGATHIPANQQKNAKYPFTTIEYPTSVTMTAIDVEGARSSTTVGLALRPDLGPAVNFKVLPVPGKPVPQSGDTLHLDTSGVHAVHTPIAWYELDYAPNPPADLTADTSSCVDAPKGATGLSPGDEADANGHYHSVNKYTGEPADPATTTPKKPKLPGSTTTTTTATQPAGLGVQATLPELLQGKTIERNCTTLGGGANDSVPGPGATVITSRSLADVNHIDNIPAGDWAISLTAYDSEGMQGRKVVYPVHVDAAQADCVAVAPKSIADGSRSFGLSGDCITNRGSVYVSSRAVDVDGLQLTPAPGSTLVFVNRTDGQGAVFSTTSALPSPLPADLGGWATTAKGHLGGVDLRIGDDLVGGWTSFGATKFNDLLDGNDGDPGDVAIPAGSVYRTLPIVPQSLAVAVDAKKQSSEVSLHTALPAIFGGGDTEGNVDVSASNVAANSSPNAYPSPYPARSVHQRRPEPIASAADDDGANTLPVPGGSSLGPIPLPDGLSFKYDDAQRAWVATVTVGISDSLPGASLTLVIRGGDLVSASGTIPGPIPIAGVVDLSTLHFTINTSPFTIIAGTTVSIADVLDGTGQLTLVPDPFDLRIDAQLEVADFLPLGSGFVEFSNGAVTFGGESNHDFGPASFDASVSGGVNLSTKQFYVYGSGRACLFACVGVQAILSSKGIAACGSVDLLLTSVEIGLGYKWGGDLSLWLDSCGLDSFKVPLSRAAPAARAVTPTTTIPPGGSDQIKVPSGLKALAIRVHGPAGSTTPPQVSISGPTNDRRIVSTPATLGDYSFGLDGAGTQLSARVAAAPSPTATSAVTKQGTGLSEENTTDGTTTLIVAEPKAGTWTLKVASGSVPVSLVESAKTAPPAPISAGAFKIKAGGVSPKTKLIGSRFPAVHSGHAVAAAGAHFQPTVTLSQLPALERKRVRSLSYSVDARNGGVAIVDQGPAGTAVLAEAKAGAKRTGAVAFDPAGAGKHTIKAITLDANGLPISIKTIRTYVAPAIPTPGAPGIVKIVHRSTTTYVLLSHGPSDPTPDATAYYVRLHASGGIAQGFIVRTKDVRTIDGHPAITLRGIPAKATLHIRIHAAFGGRISSASKRG